MSTRKTLLQNIARELGWRTGSVSSGAAQNVVLDGYSVGEDNYYNGWTLCMPDAATAADMERVVTAWDDSSRTAYWVNARTDTTYTSETYILIPPYDITLDEVRTAINDVLAECRFTTYVAIPTLQDERFYRLGRFSWVRYPDDVDGVFTRNSPNLLSNSQFDAWGAGASAAPSSWVLAGSGGTVARATTVPRGYYGATITRSGADTTLTQTLGRIYTQLAGQSMTFSSYVRATVASRARIGISDGLTTTYSSYHTGGGGDELLSVSKTLAAGATSLSVILSVDTNDTSATFSNAVAQEGSSVDPNLTTTGDQSWEMRETTAARVRSIGDQVVIELPSATSRGSQIVVSTGMPYPALTADSDSTDAPDSLVLHGAVDQVVSRMRKGQSRDRLEALRARHHNQFIRLSGRRRERPTVEITSQNVTRGA